MKCYASRGENYDTAIFGDSDIVVTPHCHFTLLVIATFLGVLSLHVIFVT